MVTACPTPEKQAHRSEAAALKARDSLERARGIDLQLRPYPCGDHWHLGHSHKAQRVQLAQALAQGFRASRRRRRPR